MTYDEKFGGDAKPLIALLSVMDEGYLDFTVETRANISNKDRNEGRKTNVVTLGCSSSNRLLPFARRTFATALSFGLLESPGPLVPGDAVKPLEAAVPLSFISDVERVSSDKKRCGYELGETHKLGALRVTTRADQLKAAYAVHSTRDLSLDALNPVLEALDGIAPLFKGAKIIQKMILSEDERKSVDKLRALIEGGSSWSSKPAAKPSWNWRTSAGYHFESLYSGTSDNYYLFVTELSNRPIASLFEGSFLPKDGKLEKKYDFTKNPLDQGIGPQGELRTIRGYLRTNTAAKGAFDTLEATSESNVFSKTCGRIHEYIAKDYGLTADDAAFAMYGVIKASNYARKSDLIKDGCGDATVIARLNTLLLNAGLDERIAPAAQADKADDAITALAERFKLLWSLSDGTSREKEFSTLLADNVELADDGKLFTSEKVSGRPGAAKALAAKASDMGCAVSDRPGVALLIGKTKGDTPQKFVAELRVSTLSSPDDEDVHLVKKIIIVDLKLEGAKAKLKAVNAKADAACQKWLGKHAKEFL
jgi:hypothetical protein